METVVRGHQEIIRSSTGKSHSRARQAFLQAAASVARSHCAFGTFYRRLKARVGPARAQVATAHKIARVYQKEQDRVPANQRRRVYPTILRTRTSPPATQGRAPRLTLTPAGAIS